jgi:hypothetical protein
MRPCVPQFTLQPGYWLPPESWLPDCHCLPLCGPTEQNTMYPDLNTGRSFLRSHRHSTPNGQRLRCEPRGSVTVKKLLRPPDMPKHHDVTRKSLAFAWCCGICTSGIKSICMFVLLPRLMLRLPSRLRRSSKAQRLRAPQALRDRLATLRGYIQLLST